MKKVFTTIGFVILVGAFGYYFRAPLRGLLMRFEGQFFPCSQPIVYEIGTFDTRFGISKNSFAAAISKAEQIWEVPAEKELFVPATNSTLKINLIYDYRQDATQKLKALGLSVEETRSSYDALQAQYEMRVAEYNTKKSELEAKLAVFNRDQNAYNAEVATWNKRGGISKNEYALEAERVSLEARRAELQELQTALNVTVNTTNALAVTLNRLATTLNISVAKFNEIGATRGEEFDEGLYRSDATGQSIDIYQFDNNQKLIRVLAHELGHALGLAHVDDPKAIMYRLNQGTNEKLAASDLTELRARCNLK